MRPKDAGGIANSVDPDDCFSRSSLIWVCTVRSDLSVRKLRVTTVALVQALRLATSYLYMTTSFPAYRNDPKFSDRYAWANSADPDQTASTGAV